jgi:Family of unknown function (DUF6447)
LTQSYSVKESELMPTITIDGIEYELDALSNEAKTQIAGIQFVDSEISRLTASLDALQTARIAYVTALKAALPVLRGNYKVSVN